MKIQCLKSIILFFLIRDFECDQLYFALFIILCLIPEKT